MKKYLKLILSIIALVILIGGSSFAYKRLKNSYDSKERLSTVEEPEGADTPSADADGKDSEKYPAPNFTVYTEDGEAVTLDSMKGKPVVVNFWASWCPPCKSEMPEFQKVFEELGTDVTFMMVDMTDGARETKEKAIKHIQDNDYTFPAYFDMDSDAATVYNVSSIPTTYFIDKDGYLVTYASGAIDEETLRLGIDMITNEE
ncbi:MAG TPA: TlpA disulfide reductase family protein [Lachnospiraceae bacterium]|nr:TlpA disulfide reductase family protein [Lachnospiraceae bacterium]